MCIDSLIKKKKYDSLESFVNKISGQISKELDFICTNNVIVDAVLNTKYQEIRDKGIVFVFSFFVPLQGFYTKRLWGNLNYIM